MNLNQDLKIKLTKRGMRLTLIIASIIAAATTYYMNTGLQPGDNCKRVNKYVSGDSMYPVFKNGQNISVVLNTKNCSNYKNGDTVVFKLPGSVDYYIKTIFGSYPDQISQGVGEIY